MTIMILGQRISKLLIVLFVFCINTQYVKAQNIVINGGFEIGNKSRFATYVKDSGYVKIGTGSQLSLSDAEIYVQARGKRSAGCFTARNDKYQLYGSLVLSMSKKMEKNKWYEISFFIKHGYGLYAASNNGIALSSKEFIQNYHKLPIKSLIIVNKSIGNHIIKNQEWELYTFLYKSNGTEDVLLIGNVFFNNILSFEAIETPKDRYKDNLCLYLFDEVKIVPFEHELNIYFNENSAALSESGKLALDDLSVYIATTTINKIIVKGYADKTGVSKVNDELSLKRAEEVKKYLSEKSSKDLEIETQNFGSTDKFDKNKLETNRLVEIEIIQ